MPTPCVKRNLQRDISSTNHLKGWLMKQTHGRRKVFQKRYFVLYNEELIYYKNKDEQSASAIISLEHYTLVPIVEPEVIKENNDRTFCLVSDDETKFDWPDYFLQAESESEKQIWIDRLQTISRYSVSVLDKWLKRMEILSPVRKEDSRIDSRMDSRITMEDQEGSSISSSIQERLSQNGLRNYRSAESLKALQGHKRRPSDYLTLKKSSKYTQSSSSSIISVPEEQLKIEKHIIHPSQYNH